MYVISLKWREKPGQPVTSCAFFFCSDVCECGETQGLMHTALHVSGVKGQTTDSRDQTAPSLPSLRNHTQTLPRKSLRLCSLSVFKPRVWFVSIVDWQHPKVWRDSASGSFSEGRWCRHHLTVLECACLSYPCFLLCFFKVTC